MKYRVGMRLVMTFAGCMLKKGSIGVVTRIGNSIDHSAVYVLWEGYGRATWASVKDRDASCRILDDEIEEQQL